MEKNEVKAETKVNRYTILDAEVKRVSKELKAKKQEMLKAIKDAEAEYRKYRKEVYNVARAAAFKKFAESKVVGTKKAADKKITSKKVTLKKDADPKITAAEVIDKGEKAIAKFKAVAAQNKAAK